MRSKRATCKRDACYIRLVRHCSAEASASGSFTTSFTLRFAHCFDVRSECIHTFSRHAFVSFSAASRFGWFFSSLNISCCFPFIRISVWAKSTARTQCMRVKFYNTVCRISHNKMLSTIFSPLSFYFLYSHTLWLHAQHIQRSLHISLCNSQCKKLIQMTWTLAEARQR